MHLLRSKDRWRNIWYNLGKILWETCLMSYDTRRENGRETKPYNANKKLGCINAKYLIREKSDYQQDIHWLSCHHGINQECKTTWRKSLKRVLNVSDAENVQTSTHQSHKQS